jgi:hypothetical protein
MDDQPRRRKQDAVPAFGRCAPSDPTWPPRTQDPLTPTARFAHGGNARCHAGAQKEGRPFPGPPEISSRLAPCLAHHRKGDPLEVRSSLSDSDPLQQVVEDQVRRFYDPLITRSQVWLERHACQMLQTLNVAHGDLAGLLEGKLLVLLGDHSPREFL